MVIVPIRNTASIYMTDVSNEYQAMNAIVS
jgi:hypothetical protein